MVVVGVVVVYYSKCPRLLSLQTYWHVCVCVCVCVYTYIHT
jgi:hypothetical protein